MYLGAQVQQALGQALGHRADKRPILPGMRMRALLGCVLPSLLQLEHSGRCGVGGLQAHIAQLWEASFPVCPRASSPPLLDCEAGMGTLGCVSGLAVHAYQADHQGKSGLHP